jgi:hypothetical protein
MRWLNPSGHGWQDDPVSGWQSILDDVIRLPTARVSGCPSALNIHGPPTKFLTQNNSDDEAPILTF